MAIVFNEVAAVFTFQFGHRRRPTQTFEQALHELVETTRESVKRMKRMKHYRHALVMALPGYTERYLEAVPRMVSRSRKRGPERRGT